MKRDFDLIRKILLYVEENQKEYVEIIESLEGYDNLTVIYHCQLLLDVGFLEGRVERVNTGEGHFISKGLSWYGHDYLASIKNDTVWKKVKKTVGEKGLELTVEIISRVATNIIEDSLGI
jgi:hypothetical protein